MGSTGLGHSKSQKTCNCISDSKVTADLDRSGGGVACGVAYILLHYTTIKYIIILLCIY